MPDLLARKIARIAQYTSPYLLRRRCSNFFWSVLWQFTAVCNARCVYCTQQPGSSHPDPFEVLRKVKELKPRDILLMGGEPYLYPEIVRLLGEIERELDDPYVTVSTNLSVRLETVKESLPLLDRLQVSIDGLGEINRRVRCFDGDEIAARIVMLADHIRERGLPTSIFTHSVVTVHNLDTIEEFVESLQGMVPGMKMGFSLVEPYRHELSIANDRKRLGEFIAAIVRLKERYPVNICDRLVPPSPGVELPVSSDHESEYKEDYVVSTRVKCRRQYFFAFVSPAGEIATCHPHLFYHQYKSLIKELVAGRRYMKAARTACRMVDQLLIRPFEPTCYFPCKCQRFIEDILEAGRHTRVTPDIEWIAGKFSRGELDRVQEFLGAKYGDPLVPEVVELLLESEEKDPEVRDEDR